MLFNRHNDPIDISLNVYADPELDGYHITSEFSACVDAGVDTLETSLDIDNEIRIRGRNCDIGADESDWESVAAQVVRLEPSALTLSPGEVSQIRMYRVVGSELSLIPHVSWEVVGSEIDNDGTIRAGSMSGNFEIRGRDESSGQTASANLEIIATSLEISSCFPNPFNPTITISFAVQSPGYVNLSVYDVSGQLVRTVVDTYMDAGKKTKEWNGMDQAGIRVASGIYFLRLETDQGYRSRKIMLAK